MAESSLIDDDKADEPETESGRRMDPELRTIAQMIRLMSALEEDAQTRVMAYLSSRWQSAKE